MAVSNIPGAYFPAENEETIHLKLEEILDDLMVKTASEFNHDCVKLLPINNPILYVVV